MYSGILFIAQSPWTRHSVACSHRYHKEIVKFLCGMEERSATNEHIAEHIGEDEGVGGHERYLIRKLALSLYNYTDDAVSLRLVRTR